MKLEGKVALITGAATGIGRASALLFAQEGARVAIADINEKDARATEREIRQRGGEAICVRTDLVRIAEIEAMVRSTVSHFGRLDIFFHNAGVAGPGRIELTSEEAYDQIMDVCTSRRASSERSTPRPRSGRRAAARSCSRGRAWVCGPPRSRRPIRSRKRRCSC
jgi:NAD(P)-dependent dehydrogenase (short-subunit alcohol dehydrogenase family)